MRNRTHLYMSSDSPFARGPLAEEVGLDGEGKGVEEMLQGIIRIDRDVLEGASASSEMKSFTWALKTPTSKAMGEPVPTMVTEMSWISVISLPTPKSQRLPPLQVYIMVITSHHTKVIY